MDYNDLLVAQHISEMATKQFREAWTDAQEIAAKTPGIDWTEAMEAWEKEHPHSSFVEKIFTDLLLIASQIRRLEDEH